MPTVKLLRRENPLKSFTPKSPPQHPRDLLTARQPYIDEQLVYGRLGPSPNRTSP